MFYQNKSLHIISSTLKQELLHDKEENRIASCQ